MVDYVKSTNFASKDSLASGNANKIVKGTEIDTEFNNIAAAVATKADLSGATLTGATLTSPTLNSPTLVTPVLGTPTSGTLTNCTFPTLNQNTTGTSGGVSSGSWTVTISGTKLYFAYGGVNKGSLDSSGNFVVTGNVTAYGTP